MFQENEKEWILEAINHLKHRKARPDLSRISLRMKRKHQMSFAQTKKLLESLIESGIVVKAVYKNNTSYRDVSKWKKGRLGGQIMNSHKMLKRFIRAIESIEKEKDTGVSAKDIEDYLASQSEEKCFLAGAALRDALENEIDNGYLKKISVGTQALYTVNTENLHNVSQMLETNELSDKEYSDKKEESDSTKTISEPDVGHLLSNVQKAIYETENSEGTGASLLDIKESLLIKGIQFADDSFLLELLENNVRKGSLTKLMQGTVALYAVHEATPQLQSLGLTGRSCIDSLKDFDEVKVRENCDASRDSTSCPALFLPETSTSGGVVSEECKPPTSAVPLRPPSKRRRIVKDHGPDFEIDMPTKMKSKPSETKEPVYPTPTASPVSEIINDHNFKMDARKKRGRPKKRSSGGGEQEDDDGMEDDNSRMGCPSEQSSIYKDDDEDREDVNLAPEYPDASNWTSQQVADYFQEKGYIEEANSMLENDLDGAALGLLRRSDIVGPPLGGVLKVKKLGVALKLFRDIRDLLFQGNADNYVDPYEERAFLRS